MEHEVKGRKLKREQPPPEVWTACLQGGSTGLHPRALE